MKLLFMLGATLIESNLRKANKRFSAIQACEVGRFGSFGDLTAWVPLRVPNLAHRIAAALARFRYTCELIYPC
jgi:hypothetical protein